MLARQQFASTFCVVPASSLRERRAHCYVGSQADRPDPTKRPCAPINADDFHIPVTTPISLPSPASPVVDCRRILPFLLLPAEIRLQVYGLLFKLDTPVFLMVERGQRQTSFHKGVVLGMVLANK